MDKHPLETAGSTYKAEDPAWVNALIAELWPTFAPALVTSLKDVLECAVRVNMPRMLPSIVFTSVDLGDIAPIVKQIALRWDPRDDRPEPVNTPDGFAKNTHPIRTQQLPSPTTPAKSSASSVERTNDILSKPGTSQDEHREQRRSRKLWRRARYSPPASVEADYDGAIGNEDTGLNTPVLSVPIFPFGIADAKCDVVVVELAVEFHGTPRVQMALENFSASFGIDKVDVVGRLEVIIAPILGSFPMFGAFQAGFVNRPQIDFNLTGLAAAGDMGPWMRKFREVVQDAFASIAVLPNRLSLRLNRCVDYLDMARAIKLTGVLRIAVVRGRGFPHTDENRLKQSLGCSPMPDVYVVVSLGATTRTTKRVDNADAPTFDQEVFDFVLSTTSFYQTLNVRAYDFDIDSMDDELGHADVSVRTLLEHPETSIRLKNSPMGAIPTLTLAAQLLPVYADSSNVHSAIKLSRSPLSWPPHCSPLMLSVTIDRATNLIMSNGRRPYVRVLMDGAEISRTWNAVESQMLVSSVNVSDVYVWECTRYVLIHNRVDASTRLSFEVLDESSVGLSVGSGNLLGTAFILLADLANCDPCLKTYNFALCHAERALASLRVCLGLLSVRQGRGPYMWDMYKTSQ